MADNIAITAGSGTTVNTDDVGGVHTQRVKVTWGPDGTVNDADVATGKPVPIQVRSATGLVPIGEPTDAKSTATDATSTSLVSIAKQVSASVQLSATAAQLPATLGSKAAASAFAVTDSTEDIARQGIITETAPASDTASSGLNGRLQRIAQHLSLLVTEAQSTDPVVVSGGSYSDSADFTPAAASHVAGDCNGAAQEFTTMGLSAGRVMITSAELMIFGATVEVTAWRLYLYNITPPSAYADDTAWDLLTGDRASWLGYVDLGTAVDLGGTQWVETHAIQKQVKLAGTSLFGYLVNLTTLTPANVAHTVTLHAVGL